MYGCAMACNEMQTDLPECRKMSLWWAKRARGLNWRWTRSPTTCETAPCEPNLKSQIKFDHGDDRLTKRGTSSFQARLDKTLLAMHVPSAHDG